MRRLLLLLLAFLLPLQLLAAPVGELTLSSSTSTTQGPAHAGKAMKIALQVASPVHEQVQADVPAQAQVRALGADLGSQAPVDDDQSSDDPAKHAECEDHAMPGQFVTPGLSWLPFPHAFQAPPGGASFVRDQLHPPPLA